MILQLKLQHNWDNNIMTYHINNDLGFIPKGIEPFLINEKIINNKNGYD